MPLLNVSCQCQPSPFETTTTNRYQITHFWRYCTETRHVRVSTQTTTDNQSSSIVRQQNYLFRDILYFNGSRTRYVRVKRYSSIFLCCRFECMWDAPLLIYPLMMHEVACCLGCCFWGCFTAFFTFLVFLFPFLAFNISLDVSPSFLYLLYVCHVDYIWLGIYPQCTCTLCWVSIAFWCR